MSFNLKLKNQSNKKIHEEMKEKIKDPKIKKEMLQEILHSHTIITDTQELLGVISFLKFITRPKGQKATFLTMKNTFVAKNKKIIEKRCKCKIKVLDPNDINLNINTIQSPPQNIEKFQPPKTAG